MKKLYHFFWDCGRIGDLSGLFISTDEEVDKIQNKEIYFGEVLGKHSDVGGVIEKDDIQEMSDDQDLINKLESIFKRRTITGYNPFDYI